MAEKTKINWLSLFLEFIVVIVGILIAFQLNTCSQERKEERLIDRHLANIMEETRFNQRNIRANVEATETLKLKIDSLIVAIQTQEDPSTVNTLSLEVLQFNSSYYKKVAYNTLIESGDVRHFKDYSKRDEIIQLYEYYAWAEGLDEATLKNYTDYFYPYVVENLDLVEGQPQDIKIYDNKRYLNILATYSYMMNFRLSKYRELLEKANDFLAEENIDTEDQQAAANVPL